MPTSLWKTVFHFLQIQGMTQIKLLCLWNTVFHFLQIQGMTQSKAFVSVCVFLFFVVLVLCFSLPHQGRKLMKPGKIPQHQVQ